MQHPNHQSNVARHIGLLLLGNILLSIAVCFVLIPGEALSGKNQRPKVRAVTHGPMHHFFGYYDKCPWDQSGQYLLANEIGFVGRQPKKGEALTVGMVDLKNNDKYIPLDKTLAWCWQQGCMLQWLGSAPDREVIYNSIDDGKYIAIIRNVHSGVTRQLPRPIYHLSRDGKQAVTLDFDRLNRLRPGYGYMALPEKYKDDPAPKKAGIYWMDVPTGKNRLIISLHTLAQHKPDKRFKGAHHWVNHLQFNPSGKRFLFLHRWSKPGGRWQTRLFTAKPDGSDLQLVIDTGMVSHFDWRDDHTILAWTRMPKRGDHFYTVDTRTKKATLFGKKILQRDGHCSYSPDRRWVLNDTYPDAARMQTLMLIHVANMQRYNLGKFYLPSTLKGPWRCDLHPRWNRDGTQVCIDSGHEKTRQMYVVDVGYLTRQR